MGEWREFADIPTIDTNLTISSSFLYKDNPNDVVKIKLGLNDSDELLEDRKNLLAKIKIPSSTDLDLLPTSPYISPELLGFVRVFNMNKGELQDYLNDSLILSDSNSYSH